MARGHAGHAPSVPISIRRHGDLPARGCGGGGLRHRRRDARVGDQDGDLAARVGVQDHALGLPHHAPSLPRDRTTPALI